MQAADRSGWTRFSAAEPRGTLLNVRTTAGELTTVHTAKMSQCHVLQVGIICATGEIPKRRARDQ